MRHYRNLSVVLLLAFVLAAAGCSDRPTGPSRGGNVQLDVDIDTPKLLQVQQGPIIARLTVLGADIMPIVVIDTITSQGVFELVVSVPSGQDRVFTLELLRQVEFQEVILYRGVTVADVLPDQPITLPITLLPTVPMLKLIPKDISVESGAVVPMELRAYNMPGLTYAKVVIDYGYFTHYSWIQPISTTSPAMAPGTPFNADYCCDALYYVVEVGDSLGLPLTNVPPAGNYVSLGTVNMATRAFTDTSLLPVTMAFSLPDPQSVFETTSLYEPGNPGLQSGVYFETSRVQINPLTDGVITFPDSVLERVVYQQLYPQGGTGSIFLSDALGLRSLNAVEWQIEDLTGVGQLANLTAVSLGYTTVQSLVPLTELQQVTSLALEGMNLTSIAPLADMPQLRTLNLYSNQISDLSPLVGMQNLSNLSLPFNQVSDLTPLQELGSLYVVDLANNQIVDLTPLAMPPDLYSINLSNNQITDLAPLVANPGIGANDIVTLRGNPLSTTAVQVQIPVLQERGVIVNYP